MTEDENVRRRICYFSDEDWERIRAVAEATETTMAEILRLAWTEWLAARQDTVVFVKVEEPTG